MLKRYCGEKACLADAICGREYSWRCTIFSPLFLLLNLIFSLQSIVMFLHTILKLSRKDLFSTVVLNAADCCFS